jgi:protein phosphatase
MGTTLTLLYIGSKGITAAHMGDSRIYHIRPEVGVLYQSRDHSLVFDLFQAGEITFEQMATYPQKNMVTRAMMPGEDNRMRPDIIHITDIQPNDYFYMCSDGMMEKMTNNELLTLFSADMDDKMKVGQLKMATNQNFDNHTAWIIHVKDVIKEDNDDQLENEEILSRINAINILPHPVYDAEDDDVVVVGGKKKSIFQKIIGIFK